jgi:hypothetical protein
MNILPSIVEQVYEALRSTLRWTWDNRQNVLNIAVVITALVLLCQLWLSYGNVHLVLFVGQPGSEMARVGQRLVDRIATTRNSSGVNYRISLEQISESSSIRDRMKSESSRIPLGFVDNSRADNIADDDPLRVLLPLEWEYLYVLCSREFLKHIQKEEALTLAEVVHDALKGKHKGRVYLGPNESASFTMAKLAIEKFGPCPNNEDLAQGIYDWRMMKRALKAGDLDLAFYTGPLGDDLIKEIADDKKSVLLSLGEITEAIQYEMGFQVYAANLPRNLFIAKEHKSISHSEDEETPVAFCREHLHTIAIRRVLACPRSLSTADAYLLASTARTVFEENDHHINLKGDDPPFRDVKSEPGFLRMLPHPGMELLKDGRTPPLLLDWTTWPGWIQTIASLMLGLVALDLLRLLTRRQTPDGYTRLDDMLKNYETRVGEKTHRDIAEDLAAWDEALREVRKALHESPGLSRTDRKTLWRRYRALASVIESSLNWVAKAPAKRGTSSPKGET